VTNRRPTALLAADCYPPSVGGTERHVELVARGLADRGWRVVVVTSMHPTEPDRVVDGSHAADGAGSLEVRRLSGWARVIQRWGASDDHRYPAPAPDPGLVSAIAGVVDEVRPDVIHAHGWIVHDLIGTARRRRVPLVLSLHDYGMSCPTRTMLRHTRSGDAPCGGPTPVRCGPCVARNDGVIVGTALWAGVRLGRHRLGGIDAWIANSTAVADAVRAGGVPVRDVRIVPPAPVQVAAAGTPRPTWMPSGRVWMFAGALRPHKGVDVLAEAWRRFSNMVPETDRPTLLAVGTSWVDSPTVVGIDVVPAVPHREVLAAWGHAEVAVVPSRWPEPYGMVAAEAMAAGCAVVASDTGGLGELVDDGIDGLLVTPGDPVTLCEAFVALHADPALAALLGTAARAASAARAVDPVDAITAIYAEVMRRRAPSTSEHRLLP